MTEKRNTSSSMPANKAAYLNKAQAYPLEIKDAPYTQPRENEILVKNAALAINPVDWMIQLHGTALMYNWLRYPAVLGYDLAGTVVEVGPKVSRFKVGDRVVGQAVGPDQQRNRPAEGAFQLYTVVSVNAASQIPDDMSFESAATIPLGASTAACALFQKDLLGLQRPSLNPKPTGKTVLIWGGSTSVGLSAIQLAVAAGYEVYTTASPKNFALVKRLGAAQVWDYNSPNAVAEITTALSKKTTAGAVAIGDNSAEACLSILRHCKGTKSIAMVTFPMRTPAAHFPVVAMALNFVTWNALTTLKGWWRGISWKLFIGTALVHDTSADPLGAAIYETFLPDALAQGKYVPAPEPLAVGHGLEALHGALDQQRKGVSARKVVVTL